MPSFRQECNLSFILLATKEKQWHLLTSKLFLFITVMFKDFNYVLSGSQKLTGKWLASKL